jgi:hypothetical protein
MQLLEAQCGFDRAGWRAERCANSIEAGRRARDRADGAASGRVEQCSTLDSATVALSARIDGAAGRILQRDGSREGVVGAAERRIVAARRVVDCVAQGLVDTLQDCLCWASSTSTPNARLVAQLALGSVGVEQVRPFASSITRWLIDEWCLCVVTAQWIDAVACADRCC